MRRTSDGIIKNIDWNRCIKCQRNYLHLGKLRGSGKERDTLVGNLKTIWDIDKEKLDINCDHHSFIHLIMDQRILKPHLNIAMWCSTKGAAANTVNKRLID